MNTYNATYFTINLSRTNFRLAVRVDKTEISEEQRETLISKGNRILGKFTGKTIEPVKPRKGSARDFESEYKRLKYSDKKFKTMEAQISDDEFAKNVRSRILQGVITKKQAMTEMILSKKYDIKTIMFVCMHYYSCVYEQIQALKAEGKI